MAVASVTSSGLAFGKMTTPRIQAIIESFVAQLTAALSEASHAAISEALGSTPRKVARVPSGGKRSIPVKNGRRAKRSQEALDKLTQSLVSYVKRNPGQRIDQVGKALGAGTKDLTLPAKRLIASKRLSTKGQKRATTYFAK